MKLILLSDDFYNEYSNCGELLHKRNRPYACLAVLVDGVAFAIPFRHHITHGYSFITYNDCGLDFTKAVVIRSENDVSEHTPIIDTKEWNIVRKNENKIWFEFRKYIRKYKKALKSKNNPRSNTMIQYGALQYFEKYL